MEANNGRLPNSCRVFRKKRRPSRAASSDLSANFLAEDDVDPGRYEDRKLPADATDAGYNRAIHDAVDFGAARSRMLISDVSVR